MNATKPRSRVRLGRRSLWTVLVLLVLGISSGAALAAHVSGEMRAQVHQAGNAWPERTLLHEQLPMNQVVSGGFLFAMASLTTTPERGPYRLVRTTLATRTIVK